MCQMAISAKDKNGAGKENKKPGDVLFLDMVVKEVFTDKVTLGRA